MNSRGKLFLVSVGPGFVDLIPPLAMAEDEDPDIARQDRTLEPDSSG